MKSNHKTINDDLKSKLLDTINLLLKITSSTSVEELKNFFIKFHDKYPRNNTPPCQEQYEKIIDISSKYLLDNAIKLSELLQQLILKPDMKTNV
jgi:hypothetical protein